MRRQEAITTSGRQQRTHADRRHGVLSTMLPVRRVGRLLADTEPAYWTGRNTYPTQTKVAALPAQHLYGTPTIAGLFPAPRANSDLREIPGIASVAQIPGEDALYRCRRKLQRRPVFQEAIRADVDLSTSQHAHFKQGGPVDATDIKAWRSTSQMPQRDTDAAWGVRDFTSVPKGRQEAAEYLGDKRHVLVDANHGVPITRELTLAQAQDGTQVLLVFEQVRGCYTWSGPRHALADNSPETMAIQRPIEGKYDCHPVIPLKDMRRDEAPELEENGAPAPAAARDLTSSAAPFPLFECAPGLGQGTALGKDSCFYGCGLASRRAQRAGRQVSGCVQGGGRTGAAPTRARPPGADRLDARVQVHSPLHRHVGSRRQP